MEGVARTEEKGEEEGRGGECRRRKKYERYIYIYMKYMKDIYLIYMIYIIYKRYRNGKIIPQLDISCHQMKPLLQGLAYI